MFGIIQLLGSHCYTHDLDFISNLLPFSGAVVYSDAFELRGPTLDACGAHHHSSRRALDGFHNRVSLLLDMEEGTKLYSAYDTYHG